MMPASVAQSAMRSSVESRNAPNRVPPPDNAATDPSSESNSTRIVSTNAPQNSHPVTPVSSATRIDSTEPTTVTAFALIPSLTHSRAIGSMIRFQPLRNRSTAYPPHISRMPKPGNAGFPHRIRINDPLYGTTAAGTIGSRRYPCNQCSDGRPKSAASLSNACA